MDDRTKSPRFSDIEQLCRAANGNAVDLARELLDKAVPPNGRNKFGWCPHHYAARGGCLETLSLLLDAGADVNARIDAWPPRQDDAAGWTAAHLAACNGHMDALRLLAAAGADLTAKNEDGSAPADLAKDPAKKLAIAEMAGRRRAERDATVREM